MEVLLSIKPEFAEKIFKGTKKFEYRRVIFKNTDVRKVVVYASSPVKKVIGEFQIEEILAERPGQLWKDTKKYSGITKKYFMEYFGKKEVGFAIKIHSIKKYQNPRDLKEVYGIKPPQSFQYLRT